MLEILKKTLKTGCQTTKYPDIPDVPPAGFRGMPKLSSDKCTFCGECVKVCPPGVITFTEKCDEKTLVLSYCGCIFCGRCEEVCQSDAVKLTPEYELASLSKEDLVTIILRKL